jgi:hypothetical protein
MTNEQWIAEELGGNGRGLISGNMIEFADPGGCAV